MGKKKTGGKYIRKRDLMQMVIDLFQQHAGEVFDLKRLFRDLQLKTHPSKMLCVDCLEDLLADRREKMPEGSYTTSLFRDGVNRMAQKVGEEAVESVVEAVDGNRDRFIYEASDMIYHLLVLMEQMGCSIEDLERELSLRHK